MKKASSSLRQKSVVFTRDGVINKIGFSPLSLFDGIKESAWCEGVKGSGIGQWVEFKLLKNVSGLTIQNGFIKSLCKINNNDMNAFYKKNNRVKKAEILSADGSISVTINLKDTQKTQNFQVFIPKGVYKGTKWDDTCLGEEYDAEYEYTVTVYENYIHWHLEFDEQWSDPPSDENQSFESFLEKGNPSGYSSRFNDQITRAVKKNIKRRSYTP
ncbi:MAG: hypothetical protein GY754_07450 [bacterium]|nr:hypothetical protein [bacterium]